MLRCNGLLLYLNNIFLVPAQENNNRNPRETRNQNQEHRTRWPIQGADAQACHRLRDGVLCRSVRAVRRALLLHVRRTEPALAALAPVRLPVAVHTCSVSIWFGWDVCCF